MEIKKIHFILPSEAEIGNIKTETDFIKIWTLSNPSKEIIIWYDPLADLAREYCSNITSNEISKLDNKSKSHDILYNISNKISNNYLQELGGLDLFKNNILYYIENLKKYFLYKIPSIDILKSNPDFHETQINVLFNKIITDLNRSVQHSTIINNRQIFQERIKDNFKISSGKLQLIIDRKEYIKKYIFSEYFPESKYERNIQVRNLYDEFPSLLEHKLYPLYLFEIFNNRNFDLAQNLITYIVSTHFRDELIVSNKILPKLSDYISVDGGLERDATILALKKLESEGIINKCYPKEYTINEGLGIPELEDKIKSIVKEELFAPITAIDNHTIYSNFNEIDGRLDYLMISEQVNSNELNKLYDFIYNKRFDKIRFYFLDKIEHFILNKAFEYFKLTESSNPLAGLVRSSIERIIKGFRDEVMKNDQITNMEYVRHFSSRFSLYKEPISEITGPRLWAKVNIKPEKITFISKEPIPWKVFYNNTEKFLLDKIHQTRMDSNFALDIFIYIHQKDTQFLGYTRYPSYNKKGILFTYEPDKDNQKIRFKESGIIIKKPQGERPIDASQVKEYIKNNLSSEKKIRIQISGHSHPDYEFEQTTDGVVVKKVEQTVGGLRIRKLNHLFTQWFRETLSGISVDRLIFVACNLARYKDTDIETLEFLPKDSFLERFIDNFNNEGIRIKQITASDGTVSNPSETGRLFRLQRNPETGEEIFPYRESSREVRKLLINTEKLDVEMRDPETGEAMEIDERGGRYRCKAIKFDTDLTSDQILSNQFRLSENIFDTSDPIRHPEVLEVPLEAAKISNELVKVSRTNQEGHRIVGSDAMALVSSMQENPGKVLIIDIIPEKIEAVRFALRMATVFNDHVLWKTFLKSYFPKAYKAIESHITPEAFNRLLDNIFSAKIVFASGDLTKVDAYRPIKNYLEIETAHSSIDFIYTPSEENNISRRVLSQEMNRSFPAKNDVFAFAHEKDFILKRRQMALKGFQENMKALMREQTVLLRVNSEGQMNLLNQSQVDTQWDIPSNTPLELLSREVTHAESFVETYHMARELHRVYQGLVESGQIQDHHIPLLDTLEVINVREGGVSERYWSLSFMDSRNLGGHTTNIRTKASIFERVKNYISRSSSAINHVNTAGSSALNLIFGVQALCHWIEHGFKADTRGISNKSLATAIEVHFYVNATGLIQGLGETGILTGSLAANALKPYVKISLNLSSKLGGRVLLSLGRFGSKALPVIGLIVNAADVGLTSYELSQNDDPYQRPVLITNLVFSSAGLVVSIAAIAAGILVGSAVAGPLGLIGLGIALVAIPAIYLVSSFTESIRRAHHIGLVIKAIIDEIKCGAYQKNTEGKFLAAPSFMSVRELKLSSSALEVGFGKADYQPTSTQSNWFTYWYAPEGEYYLSSNPNKAKIPIDETFRSLVMPYQPGYTFKITEYTVVPFSADRNDAEFAQAKDLQKKDPGFKFQATSRGDVPDGIPVKGVQPDNVLGDILKINPIVAVGNAVIDPIANEYSFEYEQTTINMKIQEDSWRLIFPWSDPEQGKNEDEKKNIKASNVEIANRLEKISYYIHTEKGGRQTIQLPARECPVNLSLDCSHEDTSWFIHPFENSISAKDIEIKRRPIKIGKKQKFQLNGNISKIYLIIPKHQDLENRYEGMAYLEVRKNRYIYTKELSQAEQKRAVFLFSTEKHAYFYLPEQSQGVNSSGDMLWCVNIETKKTVLRHTGVKSTQIQGEGLLLIDNQGVIYHLGQDPKSLGVTSQVIGFNADWFNQRQNALKALEDIDTFLKEKSHPPVMHLYLPYYSSNAKVLQGNIVYYHDKNKYFILDAHYGQAHFLSFDAFDQNAYFFTDDQKSLIAVKGMDKNETSRKLQLHQGKIQIKTDQSYAVFLKGVIKASMADKVVRVRLSCGLVLLFYKEQHGESTARIHIKIEKLILKDDFEKGPDKKIRDVLQEALSKLEQEHLGDSIKGKTQITQAAFIAIEHKGKNIGFYESSTQRTLCTAGLPRAQDIIPLGSDDLYAYDIIDNKSIYQSQWVTHLSEIKNGPKGHNNPTKLLLEAEALELFDQTLFLKKDLMPESFSDVLVSLSGLPELDLIWIEAKNYSLDLDSFENIALSSIDLSENDPKVNIKLRLKTLQGYSLVRENFDLCLYHSKRNFSFFFKGVFKQNTITNLVEVIILLEDEIFRLSTIINGYKQNHESLNVYDKTFYPKARLSDFVSLKERCHESGVELFNAVSLKKSFSKETQTVNINGKTIFFQPNGNISIYHHNAPEDKKWTTAQASQARSLACIAVVANKAIFFGGQIDESTHSSAIDIYDVATGKWTIARASQARIDASVAVLGQKAIFFGGDVGGSIFSSVIDIYDDKTGMWTTSQASEARYGAATAVVGQKAIFFGGLFANDTSSSAIDIYDDQTKKWITEEDHKTQARFGSSVAVLGQKAIFFGGLFANGTSSSAIDIYDDKTRIWTTAEDHKTQARRLASVAVLDQKAIFFGGWSNEGPSSHIDIYDDKTRMWTIAEDHKPRARRNASITVLGQKAIFFGGYILFTFSSPAIDIYDDQTGLWTSHAVEIPLKNVQSMVKGNKAIFIGLDKDNNAQMYVMEIRCAL